MTTSDERLQPLFDKIRELDKLKRRIDYIYAAPDVFASIKTSSRYVYNDLRHYFAGIEIIEIIDGYKPGEFGIGDEDHSHLGGGNV